MDRAAENTPLRLTISVDGQAKRVVQVSFPQILEVTILLMHQTASAIFMKQVYKPILFSDAAAAPLANSSINVVAPFPR